MKLYDDAVLDAAATREAGDSGGAWRLADALLTEIPANPGGKGVQSGGPGTPELLADYATRLTTEGIHTPGGGPYSASTLDDLRDAAMAWPPNERYQQAAYRTHRQAGRPGSEGDVALKALTRYAEGGVKRRPSEIDPDAWAKAIPMVDRLLGRKAKYPVSANALRTALGQKNNTHTPETAVPTPEPVNVDAVRNLPPKERAALVAELAADPVTRQDTETAVRDVRNKELEKTYQEFHEKHAGKRKPRTGGPDDGPQRVIGEQSRFGFNMLLETEPMKASLPKLIKLITDDRDLITDDDVEYLQEWSAEIRKGLDMLDELLKLGRGLTDEALADLLKGE
jgi:hypothetical protein